jgi:hypothetical protein
MRIGINTVVILLLALTGCDLLSGDDEVEEGPPAMLKNGSFELWQDDHPIYWKPSDSIQVCFTSWPETPPGGGRRSVSAIGCLPPYPRVGIYQNVIVPDSASGVKLSFWGLGSNDAVWFDVKTPTSVYRSEYMITSPSVEGWHQYSTSLDKSVHRGDSITVYLWGWGYFDLVDLTLIH